MTITWHTTWHCSVQWLWCYGAVAAKLLLHRQSADGWQTNLLWLQEVGVLRTGLAFNHLITRMIMGLVKLVLLQFKVFRLGKRCPLLLLIRNMSTTDWLWKGYGTMEDRYMEPVVLLVLLWVWTMFWLGKAIMNSKKVVFKSVWSGHV